MHPPVGSSNNQGRIICECTFQQIANFCEVTPP